MACPYIYTKLTDYNSPTYIILSYLCMWLSTRADYVQYYTEINIHVYITNRVWLSRPTHAMAGMIDGCVTRAIKLWDFVNFVALRIEH
jgi:hypothetical protein